MARTFEGKEKRLRISEYLFCSYCRQVRPTVDESLNVGKRGNHLTQSRDRVGLWLKSARQGIATSHRQPRYLQHCHGRSKCQDYSAPPSPNTG